MSWCGTKPAAFLRSARRCSTPKRCCSSTTTRPRRENSTSSWIRACVPMSTRPSSISLLLLLAHAAAQVAQAHAERREPFVELAPVLLGQDLGRRHHRRLRARIDRGEAGDGGDDGLAAADVALQQALHRVRLAQIMQDLVHGARLRLGQAKGKSFEKELEQRPVHLQHRSLPGAAAAVGEAHRKLLREELVELHAAPGGMGSVRQLAEVGARRRAMQQPARFAGEIGEIQALAQRLGQACRRATPRPGPRARTRAARPGSARRWSGRSGSGPAAGARLRRRCGSAGAPSRRRRSRAALRRTRARAARSRPRAETASAGSDRS